MITKQLFNKTQHRCRVYVTLLVVFVAFFLFFYGKDDDVINAVQKPSQQSFSRSFHEITGFHYSGAKQGKSVCTISADRVKVEKAKVGLFRVGLMKQVLFDNATISITRINMECEEGIFSAVDNEIFSSINARNCRKIVFCPITVHVISESEEPLTTITAGVAEFDGKKRILTFRKAVKINSGNHKLETLKFIVFSKNGGAIACDGYRLTTPEGTFSGNKLKTDIYLNINHVGDHS